MTRILSVESIKETLPVYVMILIYTLVFSYAMVIRFYALKTYAYDLGNYNQALYTTLRGYGLLYYTADLPVTGGSMMGVHFSPILLMILPIYAIYPAAPSLLIIKSFALALGALPLYKLAKHLFKTKYWGYLFSAIYLLNPALQGINWFDFHPEAFFPTFCLFSLYYGLRENWLKYIIFCALTLTTTEYAAVLVVLESIYFLWVHEKDVMSSLRALFRYGFRHVNARLTYPMVTIALSIVWFFVGVQVISFFSDNPMVKGGATQWEILGADSTLSVPFQAVFSPRPVGVLMSQHGLLSPRAVSALMYDAFPRTVSALMYDWPIKLVYLTILFGSTGFLSFLRPKCLIVTLPWFMVALLSNYYAFYYVGNQYPAFLLPPIMVGAIMGGKRFLESISKKNISLVFSVNNKKHALHSWRILVVFVLGVTLIFSFFSSPLYGLHWGDWPDLTYGPARITPHDNIVLNFSQMIPSDAIVLTQQNIFPLVSSRTNAYVIPLGSFFPPGKNFSDTLNKWINMSDFILVDLNTSAFETYLIYTFILKHNYTGHFKVYAYNDGVILLKSNYTGNPVCSVLYQKLLNWKTLTPQGGGEIVNETMIQEGGKEVNKTVIRHRASIPLMDIWNGPPIWLSPGEYNATFKMKVENRTYSPDSRIATITIYSGWPLGVNIIEKGAASSGYKYEFSWLEYEFSIVHELASRELKDSDFSKPNVYQTFNLTFSSSLPALVDFTGTARAQVDIYLDSINVTQLSILP